HSQVRVADQSVDALDPILGSSSTSQVAADRCWCNAATLNDASHRLHHRFQPPRVHNPADASDETPYYPFDAHPCDSLSLDNPKRSRFRMRVAYLSDRTAPPN